jgi:hypothetical protein
MRAEKIGKAQVARTYLQIEGFYLNGAWEDCTTARSWKVYSDSRRGPHAFFRMSGNLDKAKRAAEELAMNFAPETGIGFKSRLVRVSGETREVLAEFEDKRQYTVTFGKFAADGNRIVVDTLPAFDFRRRAESAQYQLKALEYWAEIDVIQRAA